MAEVPFEMPANQAQRVLLDGAALAGASKSFLYGYPVFLDEKGFLSPLFFAEVDVEHQGGVQFVLRLTNRGEIHLNHHVFRSRHVQAEEMQLIQRVLEGEYGTFCDRLRAAFDVLKLPDIRFEASPLEEYPTANTRRGKWLNRPIIFKSEVGVFTRNLRRELEALVAVPRLLGAVGDTAAGVLAGIAAAKPAGRNPRVSSRINLLPVMPLNRSQEVAARTALDSPLCVVTGPPGTGKSQVVIDLLASCAAAGRPVLFASKNNKAVDVVRERLRTILGEDHDWSLRLGSKRVMQESREEMERRLTKLRPESVPRMPSPEIIYDLEEQIDAVCSQIDAIEGTMIEYVAADRDRRVCKDLTDKKWVDAWQIDDISPDVEKVERLKITAERLAGNGLQACGLGSRGLCFQV